MEALRGLIIESKYEYKREDIFVPPLQPPRPGPHGIDYSKMGQYSPEETERMRMGYQSRRIKEAIKIGMEKQEKESQ